MDATELVFTVMPDGRMSTRDAAIYTGYTVATLAWWRSQGGGPRFVKRGRVWYFQSDLDSWLKGGEAYSTTQAAIKAATDEKRQAVSSLHPVPRGPGRPRKSTAAATAD